MISTYCTVHPTAAAIDYSSIAVDIAADAPTTSPSVRLLILSSIVHLIDFRHRRIVLVAIASYQRMMLLRLPSTWVELIVIDAVHG